MILLIRLIHIIIGLFFFFCLGYLYYSAFSESITIWALFALVAILLEGLLLWLNKGDCPLTIFQEKLGDGKGFFGLFLPERSLPFVIPVFIVLTAIAVILIYLKHF